MARRQHVPLQRDAGIGILLQNRAIVSRSISSACPISSLALSVVVSSPAGSPPGMTSYVLTVTKVEI